MERLSGACPLSRCIVPPASVLRCHPKREELTSCGASLVLYDGAPALQPVENLKAVIHSRPAKANCRPTHRYTR